MSSCLKTAIAAIATLLAAVAAVAMRAPASADPPVDVIALFAKIPGTVKSTAFGQTTYASHRFDVEGMPDARTVTDGRLSGGTRVVIAPFRSGTIGALEAMAYAAPPGGTLQPIALLRAPTDHLAFAIRGGALEESFAVYPVTGSCGRRTREIRTLVFARGAFHERSRRTVAPDVPVHLDPHVAAGSKLTGADFAGRTPALYRACFEHPMPAWFAGDDLDLYGLPLAPQAFAAGDRTIEIVPFVSGGSGGVFTAGAFRIDRGEVKLLQTFRTNGHLQTRFSGDRFLLASPHYGPREPNCCWSQVDVTTYRYDRAADRFVSLGTHREPAWRFQPAARAPAVTSSPAP